MNKIFNSVDLIPEIQWVIAIILLILVFATLLFWIWNMIKPSKLVDEMQIRTRSWWIMCCIFLFASIVNPVVTYFALGFLSFLTLRELYSQLKLRKIDRSVLFFCYLSIPIQYFLAFKGYYTLFLIFIPVFMFIIIPFLLVLTGETKDIIRSMCILPTSLMLGVFGISHLALLISFPEMNSNGVSGKALLLFLIFITEANDIMQFVWGKIFGKHKILPKVSPNKTWEGFIGGVISTTIIGYFMGFLTPLNTWQLILLSSSIAVFGFMGDAIMSAVKRDFGVKDMSNAIPGHGGVLDRVDSLSTTASPFFHIVYFIIISS
ncbi:phosphatidate cytidylyltransferase [Flavobacteriales bacterium]|jgi:phosphatidate cytidylyltransferase|nr:phosphatidate cytidylyltransferase [Flavobacteriales bacterium]